VTADGPSPAVTCVLIFLDGAQFIDEAIRSVIAQGDHVDWELVLVDDGSTDASTAIARRWAADDPERIRYVEHAGHANLGMSASRNAGVAAARGAYIGFLDCDDVWLPSALSHGLRVFAAHPDADVVISGTWRWHGWTGEPADLARDHLMSLPDAVPHAVIEPPKLLPAMYADPGAWRIPAMCSLLITRRALMRIGGLDDQFRGLYEDQVLYAKIALHLRVVIDPRPMALYRQHHASACQVAIDAGEWQRIGPSEPERRYLEWMQTYVTHAAASDAAVLDVVARNLEHAAHGGHVAPIEPAPSFVRRHAPAPARQAVRALRRRLRAGAPPPTVVGRWSEQFLAPVAGPGAGTTLVVEAEQGEPWMARLPADAFAGRTTRQSWADVASSAATYDRIVVPFGIGATVDTRSLVAAVARRLTPCGTAFVVVPGPALDPDRPDPGVIANLVHGAVPQHRVDVESFGNPAVAAATNRPAAALGPLVDRHDPAVPVVLALTISPTRCSR
jgi:GT2 family glycosyltransferase